MLNTISIQGRLVRPVEVTKTNSGLSIGKFAVACERSAKNADGSRSTDFIPCTAFGKTADIIKQYFNKGDMILITGRLQIDSYTSTKDGQKRTSTSVIVNEFNFSGEKRSATNAPATPTASAPAAPAKSIDEIEDLGYPPDIELPFDI